MFLNRIVFILLASAATFCFSITDDLSSETPPSADIGFKTLEFIDQTRTTQIDRKETESNGRLIRMYCWYPAKCDDNNQSMVFGDYVSLASTDFGALYSQESFLEKLPLRALKDKDKLLGRSVNSHLNAEEKAGKYPVILVAQGLFYENPITHYALCENLAANGFVVVSSPLVGHKSRLVLLNDLDLDAQVQDLEFLLGEVKRWQNVDVSRIGVIGFDMGGMSALILAMKSSDVKALVTMDSGIIFEHRSSLPRSSHYYDPARLTIPWLHMCQGDEGFANRLDEDGSLFKDAKHSERMLILFGKAQHFNFTSYSSLGINKDSVGYWDTPAENSEEMFDSIKRYVTSILQIHINDSKDVELEITDEEKADFDLLNDSRGAIKQEGDVYNLALFMINNPDATPEDIDHNYADLDINDIRSVGEKFLLFWKEHSIALSVLHYCAEKKPDSVRIQAFLGYAYYVNGIKDLARLHCEKALELEPESYLAKEILRIVSR